MFIKANGEVGHDVAHITGVEIVPVVASSSLDRILGCFNNSESMLPPEKLDALSGGCVPYRRRNGALANFLSRHRLKATLLQNGCITSIVLLSVVGERSRRTL